MAKQRDFDLELWNIIPERVDNSAEALRFQTNRGVIIGRLHPANSENAVIWVGGAGGGLDGPAGGMYPRLAQILVSDEITSLR
ncbi:MAG: alpha/beta hydrolase, partial [Bacteroidota bacterium]|nr:alpha/beta hydrolase [Bacteroidota bacterium]